MKYDYSGNMQNCGVSCIPFKVWHWAIMRKCIFSPHFLSYCNYFVDEVLTKSISFNTLCILLYTHHPEIFRFIIRVKRCHDFPEDIYFVRFNLFNMARMPGSDDLQGPVFIEVLVAPDKKLIK